MDAQSIQGWIEVLFLGGLAGAVGQGARAVIGLKKASDAAVAEGKELADVFQAYRLVVSLIIGFIAGALAGTLILTDGTSVSLETVFGLAAAGYAGSDFVEGIIGRVSGSPVPGNDTSLNVNVPEKDGSKAPTPSGQQLSSGLTQASDAVG